MKAVDIQRRLAEDFGQAASGQSPRQLHLPEPVLRMAEALAEEHVERLVGADVRDAPAIAHDLDDAADAPESNLAIQRGQRSPQQVPERASGQSAGRPRRDAEAVQPKWHSLFAVAGVFSAKLPEKLLQLVHDRLGTRQLDIWGGRSGRGLDVLLH